MYQNTTDKEVRKDVLTNLDYERIEQTMTMLNWKWFDVGIPSQDQIYNKAKGMLKEVKRVAKENKCTMHLATGGLVATCFYDDTTNLITGYKLRFELTDSSSFFEDYIPT